MPGRLGLSSEENGSYVVTAAFTDEDGDAVIPNAITYSLLLNNGQIINSRDEVSVTPASSVEILVYGDDLQYIGDVTMLIEWTYDSSLGNNIPGKDEITWENKNLIGV